MMDWDGSKMGTKEGAREASLTGVDEEDMIVIVRLQNRTGTKKRKIRARR